MQREAGCLWEGREPAAFLAGEGREGACVWRRQETSRTSASAQVRPGRARQQSSEPRASSSLVLNRPPPGQDRTLPSAQLWAPNKGRGEAPGAARSKGSECPPHPAAACGGHRAEEETSAGRQMKQRRGGRLYYGIKNTGCFFLSSLPPNEVGSQQLKKKKILHFSSRGAA